MHERDTGRKGRFLHETLKLLPIRTAPYRWKLSPIEGKGVEQKSGGE